MNNFSLATAPVTKSGDTLLGLAVREQKFDIIKCLILERNADVNGEYPLDTQLLGYLDSFIDPLQ